MVSAAGATTTNITYRDTLVLVDTLVKWWSMRERRDNLERVKGYTRISKEKRLFLKIERTWQCTWSSNSHLQ